MIKKKKIIIALVIVAVIAAAGGTYAYNNTGENKTITKIGTYSMKQKDLTKELENAKKLIKKQNPKITDTELTTQLNTYTDQIKEQMIDDKIFELEATKLKIMPTVEEMNKQTTDQLNYIKTSIGNDDNYKKYLTDNNITEEYLKGEIKKEVISNVVYDYIFKDIKVEETEMKKYYEDHKTDYIKKSGANISHIVATTQDEINKIKKELDGGLKFEDAAKKYNKDGTQTNKGTIGYIEYSNTQMLNADEMKVIKALKENEVSGPIKATDGFHIFKVSGVLLADKQLTYDEAKTEVKSAVEGEKKMTLYKKALEDWKKELNVK